jgi:hypothetical protein
MQVSTEPERKPELELLVEAWKTTIEVQQHFNEISMKIRAAFVPWSSLSLLLKAFCSTRSSLSMP